MAEPFDLHRTGGRGVGDEGAVLRHIRVAAGGMGRRDREANQGQRKQEKETGKNLCFHNNLSFVEKKVKFNVLKRSENAFFVLSAKAGINYFQEYKKILDSGFHRSDDFLRDHKI
jgi:hypothetical protein